MALDSAGVDVSDCDEQIAEHEQQARDARRALKAAESVLAGCPEAPEGTPEEEVDATKLAGELARITEHNAKVAEQNRQIETLADARDEAKGRAEYLKQQAEQALVEAAKYNDRLGEAEDARKQPEDPEPIRDQLAQAGQINAAVRAKARRAEAAEAVKAAEIELGAAEAARDVRRQEKLDRLAAADFGVEGLAVNDDGEMVYNGVPFSQASQCEQLLVGAELGLRTSKLKDVFVRDASLIDEEHLAEFAALAERHGARVWLERVGDEGGADVRLIIRDGGSVAVQAGEAETAPSEPVSAASEAPAETEGAEPAPEPSEAPADAEAVEGDVPDDLDFLED
jgi:hypothetical protein